MGAIEVQQESLNSLASMVLQNQWALDILTIEVGETCTLVNETCCMWINTSLQVEESLNIIKKNIKLIDDLKMQVVSGPSWLHTPLSQFKNSLWPWLLPFLFPLIITILVLFGLCLLNLYTLFPPG